MVNCLPIFRNVVFILNHVIVLLPVHLIKCQMFHQVFSLALLYTFPVFCCHSFWNVLMASNSEWGYYFQEQGHFSVSTFDILYLCYFKVDGFNVLQIITFCSYILHNFPTFFGTRVVLGGCFSIKKKKLKSANFDIFPSSSFLNILCYVIYQIF